MKKKLPCSGKSYSPSPDTGEWRGSDGFPHALSRISFLLRDCVNTAEGIVRDKYHNLNPAMLEWQKTFRSDTEKRINPLFCPGYPLTYPVSNSNVKHLDCIPYCAFHACLEAAFYGNYNLGLSVLDIEKDLARCFMYTQEKLVENYAVDYNSCTDAPEPADAAF